MYIIALSLFFNIYLYMLYFLYLYFLANIYVVLCAIWYHSYNLKNVRNIHGGVILSVSKVAGLSLQLY